MKTLSVWTLIIAVPLWVIAAGVVFACYQEYKLQNAPPQVMGGMVINPQAAPAAPAPDPRQNSGTRG
jgi:hypothetical protein